MPASGALKALDLSKVELIPALLQPTCGHALPISAVSGGCPSPVVEQPISLLVIGPFQAQAHGAGPAGFGPVEGLQFYVVNDLPASAPVLMTHRHRRAVEMHDHDARILLAHLVQPLDHPRGHDSSPAHHHYPPMPALSRVGILERRQRDRHICYHGETDCAP